MFHSYVPDVMVCRHPSHTAKTDSIAPKPWDLGPLFLREARARVQQDVLGAL